MEIKVKKTHENAILPTRGSGAAAGYDLYAVLDAPVSIEPHGTHMLHTGLSMVIPEGYFGAVFARSGLAAKENLRPANCVGVIDADYRGEIMVPLHNDSESERTVVPGERFAQLVIMPFLEAEFLLCEDLGSTNRGESGFGSTGK